MKNLCLTFRISFFGSLAYLLFCSVALAQAPQQISYQAVIRDASNNLIINHPIGMRVSLLQGSATATAVYVEIYNPNPSTNANGLVTIQIGTGIATSGIFSSIDWSIGPYFIKTETDIDGGTNYTITGTSQLLSVPYAFFAAKVANLSGSNTGDQDGSETKVIAGKNIAISGSGTTTNPYVVNTSQHYIGESYGGGIVFYVYDNGQHGLIAATSDQSSAIQWYNGTNKFTGTSGDGVGAGSMNTAIIVATQLADNPTGTFAAKICADYSVTVNGINYGDWYLPSKYELNLLYLQKTTLRILSTDYYWSSSENNSTSAWLQFFSDGSQYTTIKSTANYSVRAIRAF
jgi:hypothetical protein